MTTYTEDVDLAAATPRVTAILHPNTADPTAPKPPRAPRRDKGTHRPAKAEQPAGKLSREQIARIDQLREAMEQGKEAVERAGSAYLDVQKAYFDYLEELTAK
jgi:hypothetical protein